MTAIDSPQHPRFPFRRLVMVWVATAMVFANAAGATPPEVFLSRDGKALLPVLIQEPASAQVREQADALVEGLKRVTGATFALQPYESGIPGIMVGTAQEWPEQLPGRTDLPEPLTREDYRLKTTDDGNLWLVGRTPLGLQNAVWEFFHKIGYRQYFPSVRWEIWPSRDSLAVAFDEERGPSFFIRLLTVGVKTATWPQNHLMVEEWKKRNHLISGFRLETGHVYQDIVRRNQDHFKAHPEDLLENDKLDASRSSVLDLVGQYALDDLQKNPWKDSVSMDPSDGGGWRKDSPVGSPSNQAVILANHVARVIQARFPGRKVGIYAYNEHSSPPDKAVDPNVIVSIATSFILDGKTTPELIEGWRKKGATLGIRDYLSVFSWDRDLPGQSVASNVSKLAKELHFYHAQGIRYWRSEGSTAWGPHGLGYYVASRLLWNIGEDPLALMEEFYTTAFGAAAPEMKVFYETYLSGERQPLISSDLIGRMYRSLQSALEKADSPAVVNRIEDLIIYTYYIEQQTAYQNAEGKERAIAYEALARFSYRARERNIINSYAVFRNFPRRDPGLSGLPGATAKDHPFKDETPIGHEELVAIVEQGIAGNPIAGFDPVGYSTRLIPGLVEGVPSPSTAPIRVRGINQLHLFAPSAETRFEFAVRGGLIYRNRGPVRLRLYSSRNVLVDEPVDEQEIPADTEVHTVHLTTPFQGLHRLEVSDGRDLTEINWPSGQAVTLPMVRNGGVTLYGTHTLGFYVPHGTVAVAGYASRSKGSIRLPDGDVALRFDDLKEAGYFSVDVPGGADGKWWQLTSNGGKLLLTVPPYLARSPDELLLPEEVD